MICSPFSTSIVRETTLCLGGKPTLLPTLKAVNDECSLFPTPLWSQSITTQPRLGYSNAPALNFDGEKQGGGGWWLSQWQQWIPRSSSFRFSSGAWSVWRQCHWGADMLSTSQSSGAVASCPCQVPYLWYSLFQWTWPLFNLPGPHQFPILVLQHPRWFWELAKILCCLLNQPKTISDTCN